jgi:hypothetical protein
MERRLEHLAHDSDVSYVEATSGGFVLARRGSDRASFDRMARDIIDHAGAAYIALPIPERGGGFDRLIVLPLD